MTPPPKELTVFNGRENQEKESAGACFKQKKHPPNWQMLFCILCYYNYITRNLLFVMQRDANMCKIKQSMVN